MVSMWDFPKTGVPYFGVLIIRIPLFKVLYYGPLLSEAPMSDPRSLRVRDSIGTFTLVIIIIIIE